MFCQCPYLQCMQLQTFVVKKKPLPADKILPFINDDL